MGKIEDAKKKGLEKNLQALGIAGAPGTIRTCDLRIRSPFSHGFIRFHFPPLNAIYHIVFS